MIKYRWKQEFMDGYWYQQNPADIYLDAGSKERLRLCLEAGEDNTDSEAEAYYTFDAINHFDE